MIIGEREKLLVPTNPTDERTVVDVSVEKDTIENASEMSRNRDQESHSKRDEDSDESSLLDPSSAASALGTLDQNEENCKGDPDEPCPQRPSYCTGCSPIRLVMAPMAVLVFGLVGLTYYAYMVETIDATIPELVVFHILIVLLVGYVFLIYKTTNNWL